MGKALSKWILLEIYVVKSLKINIKICFLVFLMIRLYFVKKSLIFHLLLLYRQRKFNIVVQIISGKIEKLFLSAFEFRLERKRLCFSIFSMSFIVIIKKVFDRKGIIEKLNLK